MAVLVEGISVIIRRNAIESNFIGGWDKFKSTVPNQTMCTEGVLVRVGFMDVDSVKNYINELEQSGLIFLEDGAAVDLVVCDQIRGPTTKCHWVEFGKLPIEDDIRVAAAWLFEGPRMGHGLHFSQKNFELAVPRGWQYQDSLSHNGQFVDNDDVQKDLEFLRVENHLDVYWNKLTNKEVFVGRPGKGKPLAPQKKFN